MVLRFLSETDVLEVELTAEQIVNISECHWIRVTGEVVTNSTEPVHFYSFYFFDTDISVIAELELNSDNY